MAFSGALNGAFTIFFFSRMTDYFGVKWVYLMGMAAAVPCFSLFPILNLLARNSIERSGGLGTEVWVAVGLQMVMVVLNSMCCGTSVHPNEVEPPLELFPPFGCFRRSFHFHRRRLAQQGLFGGYKWTNSTVCGHRANGRTRPGELGILTIDRPLHERWVGVLHGRGAEFMCGLGGVVVAEVSLEGCKLRCGCRFPKLRIVCLNSLVHSPAAQRHSPLFWTRSPTLLRSNSNVKICRREDDNALYSVITEHPRLLNILSPKPRPLQFLQLLVIFRSAILRRR